MERYFYRAYLCTFASGGDFEEAVEEEFIVRKNERPFSIAFRMSRMVFSEDFHDEPGCYFVRIAFVKKGSMR